MPFDPLEARDGFSRHAFLRAAARASAELIVAANLQEPTCCDHDAVSGRRGVTSSLPYPPLSVLPRHAAELVATFPGPPITRVPPRVEPDAAARTTQPTRLLRLTALYVPPVAFAHRESPSMAFGL